MQQDQPKDKAEKNVSFSFPVSLLRADFRDGYAEDFYWHMLFAYAVVQLTRESGKFDATRASAIAEELKTPAWDWPPITTEWMQSPATQKLGECVARYVDQADAEMQERKGSKCTRSRVRLEHILNAATGKYRPDHMRVFMATLAAKGRAQCRVIRLRFILALAGGYNTPTDFRALCPDLAAEMMDSEKARAWGRRCLTAIAERASYYGLVRVTDDKWGRTWYSTAMRQPEIEAHAAKVSALHRQSLDTGASERVEKLASERAAVKLAKAATELMLSYEYDATQQGKLDAHPARFNTLAAHTGPGQMEVTVNGKRMQLPLYDPSLESHDPAIARVFHIDGQAHVAPKSAPIDDVIRAVLNQLHRSATK